MAARRANELMCIMQNSDEYHDVEWHDENDVDIPKSFESDQAQICQYFKSTKQINVLIVNVLKL